MEANPPEDGDSDLLWRSSRSSQEWAEEEPADIPMPAPRKPCLSSPPQSFCITLSLQLSTPPPRPSQPFPSLFPGELSFPRVGALQSGICCVPKQPPTPALQGVPPRVENPGPQAPCSLGPSTPCAPDFSIVLVGLFSALLPRSSHPELSLSTGATVLRASGNFCGLSLSQPSAPSLL